MDDGTENLLDREALIARVKVLEQSAKERSDSDAEDERRRQQYTDEREDAWRKYLDLRKRVRRLVGDHKAHEPLIVEAMALAKRYDFDIDRMEFADAKKRVADLEAVLLAHDENIRAIGEHIIESHKPGEVDDESVAILDGYHVGARAVAGGGQGEPGETTLEAALRLLKLAKQRGAFAPLTSRRR